MKASKIKLSTPANLPKVPPTTGQNGCTYHKYEVAAQAAADGLGCAAAVAVRPSLPQLATEENSHEGNDTDGHSNEPNGGFQLGDKVTVPNQGIERFVTGFPDDGWVVLGLKGSLQNMVNPSWLTSCN